MHFMESFDPLHYPMKRKLMQISNNLFPNLLIENNLVWQEFKVKKDNCIVNELMFYTSTDSDLKR